MRVIAFVLTLLALVGTGFAGEQALRVFTDDAVPVVPVKLDRVTATGAQTNSAAQSTHRWPDLFGELQPPVPVAPPARESVAAEPKPPAPPIESLGYALKGVVRAGDAVWGLVSHPTGEQIVRVGDTLSDGYTVTRITEQGLWVDAGSDTPVLLGFPEG
ncbi:MAG: hypothetical protein AAFN94_07100 [Pseudomonadota bacterium]